jgi:hypothetical protein
MTWILPFTLCMERGAGSNGEDVCHPQTTVVIGYVHYWDCKSATSVYPALIIQLDVQPTSK